MTESGADNLGHIPTTALLEEFAVDDALTTPNWITTPPDGALGLPNCPSVQPGIGRITTAGVVTSLVLSPEGDTGQITARPDGVLVP